MGLLPGLELDKIINDVGISSPKTSFSVNINAKELRRYCYIAESNSIHMRFISEAERSIYPRSYGMPENREALYRHKDGST
jgi:hypothetical protein